MRVPGKRFRDGFLSLFTFQLSEGFDRLRNHVGTLLVVNDGEQPLADAFLVYSSERSCHRAAYPRVLLFQTEQEDIERFVVIDLA